MLNLESRVLEIIRSLEQFDANPIVGEFVPPYVGGEDIRVIILEQDPTVTNEEERVNVKCTLNLNREKGPLWNHVKKICKGMGMEMTQVYATNIFKYLYKYKPKKMRQTSMCWLNISNLIWNC